MSAWRLTIHEQYQLSSGNAIPFFPRSSEAMFQVLTYGKARIMYTFQTWGVNDARFGSTYWMPKR
jgi:hypothetical protein